MYSYQDVLNTEFLKTTECTLYSYSTVLKSMHYTVYCMHYTLYCIVLVYYIYCSMHYNVRVCVYKLEAERAYIYLVVLTYSTVQYCMC